MQIKGSKIKIKIALSDGEEKKVDAVAFGPLAMHKLPEKVHHKGRKIDAFVVTHVASGLKVMTVCEADRAKDMIYKLLDAADWSFLTREQFLSNTNQVKRVMEIVNTAWRSQSRHEKKTLNRIQEKLDAKQARSREAAQAGQR